MTVKRLLEEQDNFHLEILEVLGSLVLMNHWMRGIIDQLVQQGRVELPQTEKDNWNRVINNLQNYEQFIWEIAPSRLMTSALRQYRKTGEIDKDKIDLMLKADTHGRIPYGMKPEDLDDIEDILRRLKEAGQVTSSYGHGANL